MSTRPKQEKSRLGRGLPAIFGGAQPAADAQDGEASPTAATQIEGYFLCDIGLIDPMPNQPRQYFNEDAINELAASIRDHGLLQPLVVRVASNGRYALIAGERRFRAATRLGLTRVPVVVREANTQGELELALIENLLRENLDPLEEAEAYQRLIDEHGFTHEKLGDRLHRSRSTISNALRLLQLDAKVRNAVRIGAISASHARTLITLPFEAQQLLAERATSNGWSVRHLEDLVHRVAAGEDPKTIEPLPKADENAEAIDESVTAAGDDAPSPRKPKPRAKPLRPQMAAVQKRLQEHLGTRVRIQERQGGAGSIEISYANREALQSILDLVLPDR